MPTASGPTTLRILLGSELRRLRERAGVTPAQAADAIGSSDSKISRLELGRSGFKERDVAILLSLYGQNDPREADQLLSLARRANQPGWWHSYSDLLPSWFQSYIGLEQAAHSIRCFEAQFVPGLLQTPDYAEAMLRLGDFPGDEMERRRELRRARQRRFQDGSLRLWVILDESVLYRRIGGDTVFREQLEYLLETGHTRNLAIQITRYHQSAMHAAPSSFSVLRFNHGDLPDIVYVEQLGNALYLDKQEDVDRYCLAADRLSVISTTPEESLHLLADRIKDLQR